MPIVVHLQIALRFPVVCRTFAALAEDPKFHIQHIFQPGEIEIISNQVILHSRGEIFDGEVCVICF